MPRESSRGRKPARAVEPQPVEQRVDRLGPVAGDAVRERHELEVLADGQVVVEQRRVGHERERGARVLGLGLAVRVVRRTTRTVPVARLSSPAIARTAVDLPLPLAPMSATHSPAAQLSRGMRQKAQLACALMRPRRCSCSTSRWIGLDPPSRGLLGELLLAAKGPGRRAAHDPQMGFADGLADRAVMLEEGEVADGGPWAEVRERAEAADGSRGHRRAASRRRAPAGRAGLVAPSPPGAVVGRRLDLLYTIAMSAGILGALAYGTASSALAQVVGPGWLAQSGRRWRWARPDDRALGRLHGPVVYSVADVTHPARRPAAAPRAWRPGGCGRRWRPARGPGRSPPRS